MARDERIRQAATGIAMVAALGGMFLLLVMATGLPGLAGDFFRRIAGIVTTPFLLEAALAILGLLLVIAINHWRQRREGDEFVFLEEVRNPPENVPEQARWAIFKDQPLVTAAPSASDLLEGALAIADYDTAAEVLGAMDDAERRRPDVMRLRIALATATGKHELARRLEAESAD